MAAPKPWERQPGESAKAFEARDLYTRMGARRSLDAVSRECTKSVPLMKRWSIRWKWVQAAAAYDSYVQNMATRDRIESDAARLRAEIDRWAQRDDRNAEMMWSTFAISYNALIDAQKQAEAAGKPIDPRRLYALLMGVVRTSPLAERALEIARERTKGQATPDRVESPGRVKAALRAFWAGPEEPKAS